MRKIWAGTREAPELFFQKNLKQTITYHFPVNCSFTFDTKKEQL
jgi:hypothetical protein